MTELLKYVLHTTFTETTLLKRLHWTENPLKGTETTIEIYFMENISSNNPNQLAYVRQ